MKNRKTEELAVTVYLACHNYEEYVEQSIESVLAQTYTDYELVLVDDGSTDGTSDLVERLFDDPRIRLFRKQNEGLARSRNYSIEHAQGEWLAFLDHDDVWLPRKLELQVGAMQSSGCEMSCSDGYIGSGAYNPSENVPKSKRINNLSE